MCIRDRCWAGRVTILPLYIILPWQFRDPSFWETVDLQKITENYRDEVLHVVHQLMWYYRHHSDYSSDFNSGKDKAARDMNMQSISGWEVQPRALRLRHEAEGRTQEWVYVLDVRYFSKRKNEEHHHCAERISYIPLHATFLIGRKAFKEAIQDAWKVDYSWWQRDVVCIVVAHRKFGRATFELDLTHAAQGRALMARNQQKATIRLGIAHGAERLRNKLDQAPEMPWPEQESDYHWATHTTPLSPHNQDDLTNTIESFMKAEPGDTDAESDDAESEAEAAVAPSLMVHESLDDLEQGEFQHFWSRLRRTSHELKEVSIIPYHRLRALGKGDDTEWLTCTIDISKLQAIPRHHEALREAHNLLGDEEPASMSLSKGASGTWIDVVTGLLQQIMAIIPYEELLPVPTGLQNYLELMTRASGIQVSSLEELTTDT